MTNHPKPANEANATHILKKFISKHLRLEKYSVRKKRIGLL